MYNKARFLTHLVLVSSLSMTLAVWADDTPTTPREFFTTNSVETQPAQHWQVSAGANYERDNTQRTTTLQTGLKYGVSNSMQLSLEHQPYVRIQPKNNTDATLDGAGNTTVGLQKSWRHVRGSPNSVALGVEHEFATGDAFTNDDSDALVPSNTVYVTAARDLNPSTQASLQLKHERGDGKQQNSANLAAFHDTGSKVILGEYNWSKLKRWVSPGMYWKPVKGMEVGAGLSLGVGDNDSKGKGLRLMTRLKYQWK